jgi:hypothetical protein
MIFTTMLLKLITLACLEISNWSRELMEKQIYFIKFFNDPNMVLRTLWLLNMLEERDCNDRVTG